MHCDRRSGRAATLAALVLPLALPCLLLAIASPAAAAETKSPKTRTAPPQATKPPAAKTMPKPPEEDLSLARSILRNADFLVACERGDSIEVRRYLKEGIDPNVTRASGATALQYAVAGRHSDVVKLLLAAKADPNKDSFGLMPLFLASENGDLDSVKALLAAGAKVDAPLRAVDEDMKARDGDTALMACGSPTGKASVVKALLGAGADVNAKAKNGKTSVMQAVAAENLDVLRALLEAKADVTARMPPPEDMDALTIAVGKRRGDIVKLLLDAGADPEVKLDGEVSMLEFATLSEQPEVAALLRKAGAKEPPAERLAALRQAAKEAAADDEAEEN
jgi:ankyrin repeat protein